MAFILAASVIATFAGSLAMALISANNYPGGEALSRLHALIPKYSPGTHRGGLTVHLDVPVCMTGATRFLQHAPLFPAPAPGHKVTEKDWFESAPPGDADGYTLHFDKTESTRTLLTPSFWSHIDWALSSSGPGRIIGKWEVRDVVRGFKRLRIYRPGEKTGFEEGACTGGGGWWARLGLGRMWGALEGGVRERVCRGWWVGVEMGELVWILERVPEGRGEEVLAVR